MKYNSVEEWKAEATRRFGPDMLKWRFRCPMCGHVASVQDFKDAGAKSPNCAYQECLGRYTGKGTPMKGDSSGCNWRPTDCSVFPLSTTSLSWPPTTKWTCTRSQTENRRLTMAEIIERQAAIKAAEHAYNEWNLAMAGS